jgi:uncharacterized protein YbjT (DUF2867 family)
MGATGYVGGRLVPLLLQEGHEVRCLTRTRDKLRDVPWAGRVDVRVGDALDRSTLPGALEGIDVVYYLVHAIGSGADFEASDRTAAGNLAEAAAAADVGRIVFLGGLEPRDEAPSAHLASRSEVAQILLDGPVPAVVLQAGVVIGSGSASFEMLRYLTERLPVMVTPRWVDSRIQPIAIRDVLRYLVGSLTLDPGTNRRFDIGGPDILTYRQMMVRYAELAGLRRRLIVPIGVLTPRLSSHWVNIVTPVPKALAQPLIESLRNSVVVHEDDIRTLVPFDPLPFDEAVRLALQRIQHGEVETRWAGATWPGAPADPLPSDPDWSGGTAYVDERELHLATAPEDVWTVVEGLGGERGWYSFPLGWTVRGLLDRLAGGVGLRRGRRHPDRLHLGEPLDFWRVEALERPHLLRLRAEMRLPGEAWLEFRLAPDGAATSLHQRAVFVPRGLAGTVYWHAIAPFHGLVFGSMIRNIGRAAADGPPGNRSSNREERAG